MLESNENNAVEKDKEVYGKKINSEPMPDPDIGVETNHSIVQDIIDSSDSSKVDTSALSNFLNVAQSRDQQYNIIDQMCQDSIPSAILELYAEDSTATNEDKKAVWVTSDDKTIADTVDYYLESTQINKHIYKWVSSFIKYGDLYIRLYRQSEYEPDKLFEKSDEKSKRLDEDINIHVNKENSDPFVNYLEMMTNPADMFELMRFGKTAGFIETHTSVSSQTSNPLNLNGTLFQYSFKQSDIDLYQPNQFVHASMDDNVDRVSEEVQIFLDKPYTNAQGKQVNSIKYKVRSGQSVFYNTFKIWRELSLLETSLILNRVTKSSITRVIQVETGNTAKEETQQILQSIKQMIEQKAALDPGHGMAEYNNPGPVTNNIYMATHDGKGVITTSQIGGDYDPKQLTDVDYFKNKFYGSLGVPKQYFGDTDDGAGFNGGQSLTIISAKYAKKIIKIQAAMTQLITSIMNIFLIDRGLATYVNRFTIHMLPPMTQEDLDRREFATNQIGLIRDIMDLVSSDIEDNESKLRILKSLLSDAINNSAVIDLIEEQINKLSNSGESESSKSESDRSEPSLGGSEPSFDLDRSLDLGDESELGFEEEPEESVSAEETAEVIEPQDLEDRLPTPGETGTDLL